MGVTVTGCTVKNLNVTADASAGIQLLRAFGGTVSACQVSGLVNNDGSIQGYSCMYSSDITTSNCTSSDFQSHFNGNTKTMGHTVLGFIPMLSIGLKFEGCTATNMTGCCDDCHGMSVFVVALVEVSGYTADTVTDGVTPTNTGAKATGLEVYGAKVLIKNCTVKHIKAIKPQDKQSAGFSAWGEGIEFTGCSASHVTVAAAPGEDEKKTADLGHGVGYGWAPDPRPGFRDIGAYKVEYNDCSADHCEVGFDTWFHVDSKWIGPSYTNCGTDILVQPGGKRTLSCNPCSECDPPISVTITNIASGNTYPGS